MKKLLSLFIAVFMLTSSLSTGVFATEEIVDLKRAHPVDMAELGDDIPLPPEHDCISNGTVAPRMGHCDALIYLFCIQDYQLESVVDKWGRTEYWYSGSLRYYCDICGNFVGDVIKGHTCYVSYSDGSPDYVVCGWRDGAPY